MSNITTLPKLLLVSVVITLHNFFIFYSSNFKLTNQIIILYTCILSFCTFHIVSGILLLFGLIVSYFAPPLSADIPILVTSPTECCKKIGERIKIKPVELTPGMNTGIQQTLYNSVKYGIKLEFDRHMIEAIDGGEFALDWLKGQDELDSNAPVLIVYHGLAGGCREACVQRFSYHAKLKGYRICVFTCRGCAGTILKTPRHYSSTNLDDTITTIKTVHNEYPSSQLFCIGFSLGGMILTQAVCRLSDEFFKENHVVGCSAISPTWNSLSTSGHVPYFFLENFQKSLRRVVVKNGDYLKNCLDNKTLTNFDLGVLLHNSPYKTVANFHRQFNAKIFCHGKLESYYYDVEQWYHLLQTSHIPFLTINAVDDPIAFWDDNTYQRVRNIVSRSKNMIAIKTNIGGHLGWVAPKKDAIGYGDEVLFDYLDALKDFSKDGTLDQMK
ncbi:Alpha/beta hydrolase domain protein [Entamoeba marina]